MTTKRTTASLSALALSLLALAGCNTTYVGHKLPPDGSQPTGDTGVPHNLTRHEFSLKRAADANDATKAVFTLQRTSVPDPNQRYSLALAPGFLTDGTMTYNFGGVGNLGSTEASTASQVVATIKAVASLSADMIGAKTALKDESGVWTRFRDTLKGLDPKPDDKPPHECTKAAADVLVAYEGELARLAEKRVQSPKEQDKKNLRAAWVADRFHYRTKSEQDCLSLTQKALHKIEPAGKDDYDKKVAAAIAAAQSDPEKAAVDALRELEAKDDLAGIASRLEAMKSDSPLKQAYVAAKTFLTNAQTLRLAENLAQFYAAMPLDVWRARHLAQIESDIEAAQFALLLLQAERPKPAAPKLDKQEHDKKVQDARTALKTLEEQRDQLVDAAELKQRVAAIDAQLKLGKPGDGEGSTLLSAERDRVQGLWNQARADLLARNQSFDLAPKAKAQKVQSKDNIPVALVTQDYVDKVNSGAMAADKDRQFVIVMRRLPSPTPMKPVPAASAGQ